MKPASSSRQRRSSTRLPSAMCPITGIGKSRSAVASAASARPCPRTAVGAMAMPALGYAKLHTARRMQSKALEADAMETWVCAYLSAALLVGLGLHRLLGWWWADPVGALIMVPFILWQAVRALRESRAEETDSGNVA